MPLCGRLIRPALRRLNMGASPTLPSPEMPTTEDGASVPQARDGPKSSDAGAAVGPDVRRHGFRAFVPYAAVTLVAVIALGVALAEGLQSNAQADGVARARAEAVLLAQATIEPLLDNQSLSHVVSGAQRSELDRFVHEAIASRQILRLRLRNLRGYVVYSDDGSGFAAHPEDEAIEAAKGHVVTRLTRLNGDANDSGAVGVSAVEVYLPLEEPAAGRLGVLELYIPYTPIAQAIGAGLDSMYLDLILGLIGLYVVLLLIARSATRAVRRESAKNAFLAAHDPLTGLPNRLRFGERVTKAVAPARRGRTPTAVAIVDLDGFKAVNDTLGHHNGDVLLTILASRLRAAVSKKDTVARLGGDEFGLVLRDGSTAQEELTRLRHVIEGEITVQGLPLSIEASIGYALCPADAGDAGDLLQCADVALYHAKENHLGVSRYEPSQVRYDTQSLSLAVELRKAIAEDELVLHYQPKYSLRTGALEGAEALVRWRHPERGLIYPDAFIPMIEHTDVIHDLTRWVLRAALRDVPSLGEATLAVNVSARSLNRAGFSQELRSAIAEADVTPSRLIIEITETALVHDPARASLALHDLAAAAIRSSIDDFGQGHTSLAYLANLPVAELKIDKNFILNLLTDPAHRAIVHSVIELGHNLGLKVVAEGVESEEVRQELVDLNCDTAQGYYFSRPVPIAQIGQLTSAARSDLGA